MTYLADLLVAWSVNYAQSDTFSTATGDFNAVSFAAREPANGGVHPPGVITGFLSGGTLSGVHQESEGVPEQDQETYTATRVP